MDWALKSFKTAWIPPKYVTPTKNHITNKPAIAFICSLGKGSHTWVSHIKQVMIGVGIIKSKNGIQYFNFIDVPPDGGFKPSIKKFRARFFYISNYRPWF